MLYHYSMDEFIKDVTDMIKSELTNENTAFDCNEKKADELINCITKDNSGDDIKTILNTIKMIEICKIKLSNS